MKKALLVLVAVAVAIGFASVAFSADVKVKEKTSVTPSGAEVTKTEAKIKTDTGKGTMKTTEYKKGNIEATKTKDVARTGSEKKKVKILQISDNDPKIHTDNTITYVDANNTTRKARLPKDMKVNDLKKYKDKFQVISTYKIGKEEFVKDFPEESVKLQEGMKTAPVTPANTPAPKPGN